MEELDNKMSDDGTDFGTFFLPGPTEVRREVLDAMTRPMIPHRSSAFEDLFARVESGLKEVFRTQLPVFVVPSSGTGMMEAGVRCTEPGDFLCLVNGAFSERFAHIAEMCGRRVDRYEVAWGEIHDPKELDKYLTRKKYRAITVAHSETSTGALNRIREISDTAHRHDVWCLVDSVSGLAGARLEFDEWKLDYVLTGSQKAMALPPGLAFSTASAKFIERASAAEGRGVYFDLVEMNQFANRGQVPSTPALSLMYALDVQLDAIRQEGMDSRWSRHAAMADLTKRWLSQCRERDGIEVTHLVKTDDKSPTVSTFQLPKGVEAEDFLRKVSSRGITVASGYGKLKATTFRIGHMGDHTVETLTRCLDACRWALQS